MDIIELNDFPNVAAGSPFNLVDDTITPDMSVHAVIFEMGGTVTKAQVEDIELLCEGKTLVPKTNGDILQKQNTYEGLNDTTNYIIHYFGDPAAATKRGQHLGDLDKSIYPGALTIKGKVNAAATNPTLKCYAFVSAKKQSMGIGFNEVDASMVRVLMETILQPNGAVTRKAYGVGLGSEAGARLRRVFFHDASAVLTRVDFKKAGFVKHDDIAVALNSAVQNDYQRAPQANMYVLDRIVDGSQGEAEMTVKPNGEIYPMQIKLTTSGAGDIVSLADVHTAIPLI